MDLEAVRKKLQGLQTKTTKQNNLWKPEPGNQVIRIVPNKSNADYPFHELYFHYGLGGKNYLSPTSNGNPDPLVEFAEKLKGTGSKDDWQLSRQITPTNLPEVMQIMPHNHLTGRVQVLIKLFDLFL